MSQNYKENTCTRKKQRKKKVTEIIKKNYRYKIDNIYQKAKIKNLEQSLEFQKCDVKEKKKEKKERKNEQRKTNKVAKIIKKIQVQN